MNTLRQRAQSAKYFLIVLAVLVVFFGGVFVGSFWGSAQPQNISKNVNFGLFWQVWNLIESKYVNKGNLNQQQMVYGAIDGLVNSLGDPFTEFMDPAQAKQFMQDVNGSFGGIGAEISVNANNMPMIADALQGTPAQQAGLQKGDVIMKINDKSTTTMNLDQVVQMIRGNVGTTVTLSVIEPNGTAKSYTITRATIAVPIVTWTMLPNKIAYVHLMNFDQNASAKFNDVMAAVQQAGAQKMILDMRSNPGGILQEAVNISGWLLAPNSLVVQEQKYDGTVTKYYSKGPATFDQMPTVVLMNGGSASAAEILAGALRDDRHVALIGEKSFGKGSVQEMQDFSDGSSLKLTIAKWLTPNGDEIMGKGLQPDVTVASTAAVPFTVTPTDAAQDPQIQAAIDYLMKLK
ncbi:S41 family peptidase [Patescibacteria group bacterium]|nr:S41 family peptidase [Patescibacteria group bacterium]